MFTKEGRGGWVFRTRIRIRGLLIDSGEKKG